MEFKTILFETPRPGVGLLTLNRPESLNAINMEMLSELHDLYEKLKISDEIRVVILNGAGRGFCSGADLMDLQLNPEAPKYLEDPAKFLIGIQKKYSDMILELRRAPQPIIAVVQGAAAGGGMTMALASDVVLAGPRAKFIASFINIGLSGGELGSTYFLPKLVGASRAAEILMTGRPVGAEEAEKIGLVSRVVEEEKLMDAAFEMADSMLGKSYLGLRQTKEALAQNLTAPSLEAAIELENRNQVICIFTKDFKEAVEAFAGGKK